MKTKAAARAAEAVRGSEVSVLRASAIKKADPQLHEDVKAGKITVYQATRIVKRAEKIASLAAKVAYALVSQKT